MAKVVRKPATTKVYDAKLVLPKDWTAAGLTAYLMAVVPGLAAVTVAEDPTPRWEPA